MRTQLFMVAFLVAPWPVLAQEWQGDYAFDMDEVQDYLYCTSRTRYDYLGPPTDAAHDDYFFTSTLYCGGRKLGTVADTQLLPFVDAEHLHLTNLFEEMGRRGLRVDQCDRKLYHCRYSRFSR